MIAERPTVVRRRIPLRNGENQGLFQVGAASARARRPFLLRNIGRLAMASRGSRIRVKTPVGGDNGVKWPPSLRLRPGPTTLGFKALSVANVDNRRT